MGIRNHDWKLHVCWLLLTVVVATCLTKTVGAPTDNNRCPNAPDGTPQYYDDEDGQCHRCLVCRAGYGLSEVCGDGLGKSARCQPCPDETFQSVRGAYQCGSCRLCDNTMQDLPCTPLRDRECGQCEFGYFRYNERDDHCVRCEDEKNSPAYSDCQRTTPLPQALDWSKNTQASTTHYPRTTEGPPMNLQVLIVVVVLVVIAVCVVTIILLKLFCKKCRWCSLHNILRKSPSRMQPQRIEVTDPTSTPIIQELQQDNAPDVVHVSQHQLNEGQPDLEPEPTTIQQDQESPTETEPLITPVPDAVHYTSSSGVLTHEQVLGAVPTDSSKCLLINAQRPTPDLDPSSMNGSDNLDGQIEQEDSEESPPHSSEEEASTYQDSGASVTMCYSDQGEMDSEESRRGSKESSASKATQTSSTCTSRDEAIGSEEEEDEHTRFLRRFDEAMKYTKSVNISEMHREDIDLLNDAMFEQPDRLSSSSTFHYVKFAELFDMTSNDKRRLRSAEDVLEYLSARKMGEMKVADILQKLKDCGKCFHIVRGLVKQIREREQPH